MVSFSSIAIFVLSTLNPSLNSPRKSIHQLRVEEIAGTWGSFFPSLYFVAGSNLNDHKYLVSQCSLYEDSSLVNRKLLAKGPQAPYADAIEHFRCTQRINTMQIKINVLMTRNCTGEYFGIGPTCRCQEAMRYYKQVLSPDRQFKWFLFMDDDVYIRPWSLVTMLDRISSDNIERKSVALVASNQYRSFSFSNRWQRGNSSDPQKSSGVSFDRTIHPVIPGSGCGDIQFPLAQPAILNDIAMMELASMLANNGLTQLQSTWGGSHDTLLGVLLWMYQFPVYTLAYSYFGDEIIHGHEHKAKILRDQHFIFHRLTHRVIGRRSNARQRQQKQLLASSPEATADLRAFGHIDLALLLGDMVTIHASSNTGHEARACDNASSRQEQARLGKLGALNIELMNNTNIAYTKYTHSHDKLLAQFLVFRPEHCGIASNS